MSISTIAILDGNTKVKSIPALRFLREETVSDTSNQDQHCLSSKSPEKVTPENIIKKEYDYLNSDNILVLPNDLIISKARSPSLNEEQKTQEHHISYEKIDFNCDVIRNHCGICDCSTPRLHIYLLNGHQCSCLCSRMNKATDEDIMEMTEPKIEIDDQSNEDMSFEYSNSSEEQLVINDAENDESDERETQDHKVEVNLINFKTLQNIKKEINPGEIENNNVPFRFTNIFDDDNAVEVSSPAGIPAEDFQEELMNVVTSISSEKYIDRKPKFKQYNYPLVESFEGLLKEEPKHSVNGDKLINIYEEKCEVVDHASTSQEKPFDHVDGNDSLAAIDHFLSEQRGSSPNEDSSCTTMSHLNNYKKYKKRNKQTVEVAGISFIAPLRLKFLLNSPKNNYPLPNNDVISSVVSAIKPEPDMENNNVPAITTDASATIHSKDTIVNKLINVCSTSTLQNPTEPDKWDCSLCFTSYSSFTELVDHLEEHQTDGFILCYYCQKSFGDKTSMKRHMRTHTGERPYQCKICSKRFSLPGNFKKHRDIHEDIRTEPCEVCGKTFRRKEHLKYHMRTHTGEKPFQCSLCRSSFTARYSLQIHMNIHLGRKPYTCNYCSKGFSDKSTMRKHIRVHTGERPFNCKECNKSFGESGTLAAHLATHRIDRPFNCKLCHLTFKTSGGLRQHDKIHKGDKQFSCKYCGMKFIQKYNMIMHERIHTGEKPYECSECGRTFRSRSCLGKHIILHAGDEERKYNCSHCKKRFFRKAHLKRHVDMHLGIKEYECNICYKRFCTKVTLRNHSKTFHVDGSRTFPCKLCGKVFKRNIYVTTHKCTRSELKQEVDSFNLSDN